MSVLKACTTAHHLRPVKTLMADSPVEILHALLTKSMMSQQALVLGRH